jgi:hypothetical protein
MQFSLARLAAIDSRLLAPAFSPGIDTHGIFNNAGGFIISLDVWGRPHIKPVPPWQPLVERLAAVSNLLAQAEKPRSRELANTSTVSHNKS